MSDEVAGSWELTPAEERLAERAHARRGRRILLVAIGAIGFTVVVLAGWAVVLVAGLFDGVERCGAKVRGSKVEWVDRSAGPLLTARPGGAPTPGVVVSGAATSIVPITGDSTVAQPIATSAASAVGSDGRYLVLRTGSTSLLVIDTVDGSVLAEITGGTVDVIFTEADELLVFSGPTFCELGRARVVSLSARSTRPLRVTGMSDGVAPLAIVGEDVVAGHRVSRGDSVAFEGVSLIDLATGRARRLASVGRPIAASASPVRVWLATPEETRVVDGRGVEVGRGPGALIAAALADGRVAYRGRDDAREAEPSVRVAEATGPVPGDPALPVPGGALDLAPGPAPDEVVVVWQVDRTTLGYDLCNVTTLSCRTLLRTDGEMQLGASVVGIVGPAP